MKGSLRCEICGLKETEISTSVVLQMCRSYRANVRRCFGKDLLIIHHLRSEQGLAGLEGSGQPR